MDEKNRRTLTPVLTVLGCLGFLGLMIALATRSGSADDNPAIGFPIVLVVLAVVATVVALVWRGVSKKKSNTHH